MAADCEAVLAINFAAGDAYLALVRKPRQVCPSDCKILEVPTNLAEWEGLREFGQRIVSEARAHGVAVVAFVDPGTYQGWSYNDARRRATLETAACLALTCPGARPVEVRRISQATIRAAFGCKKDDQFKEALPAALGLDAKSVVYWKDRRYAFGAALAIAKELWPQ